MKKQFSMLRTLTYTCLLAMTLLCTLSSAAQKRSVRQMTRDSLDGAFDLSDYIIDAKGFVPVPYIITEPALGGFGFALIPVFIRKRPPYIDSVKGGVKVTPVPPDITGALAVYTVNNSWMVGGFRSGTLIKSRIKYMIGGGFGSINMNFYKTFDHLGEKEMKFNIKSVIGTVQGTKRIGLSYWYAGLKYLYLNADVSYIGDTLLNNLAKDYTYTSIVSQAGVLVDYDHRDNIFTPDKGVRIHVDAVLSEDWLGSDYEYWRINAYSYMYKSFSPKWVGGLRVEYQQAFNDPPFFLKPYIDLRGVPINRYQGSATVLTEAEMRWNFKTRWSLMLFSGVGKAPETWSDFGSSDWVVSGGTGFRYLLARKFKLRVGIDIARGPEEFAYYIVFGSSWLK